MKMASSVVSSMILFLLVLLVFPHIDMVLGAQMEHRKLSAEETIHADKVTVQIKAFKFPPIHIPGYPKGPSIPKVPVRRPKDCSSYLVYCRKISRTPQKCTCNSPPAA